MTMYVVLWRFRPLEGQESEFERAYAADLWELLLPRSYEPQTLMGSGPRLCGPP